MTERRTRNRKKAEQTIAEIWKAFYHGAGRPAIAALLAEFNVYTQAPRGLDAFEAGRLEGQRDVLLRIVHLVNLKPEDFVQHMQEDSELLDRIMMR